MIIFEGGIFMPRFPSMNVRKRLNDASVIFRLFAGVDDLFDIQNQSHRAVPENAAAGDSDGPLIELAQGFDDGLVFADNLINQYSDVGVFNVHHDDLFDIVSRSGNREEIAHLHEGKLLVVEDDHVVVVLLVLLYELCLLYTSPSPRDS